MLKNSYDSPQRIFESGKASEHFKYESDFKPFQTNVEVFVSY